MSKTTTPQNPELAADRRTAAARMSTLFNSIRQSQKDNPNKWSKDARTEVNDAIKTVQFLFDEGWYPACVNHAEIVDSKFRITPRREGKGKPREDQEKSNVD